MTEEKKKSKLVSIIVECECGHVGTYLKSDNNLSFYANSSECDLCGSHGEIILNFKCSKCGYYQDIQVSSW